MFMRATMIAAMILLAATPSKAGEIKLNTDSLYVASDPEYKKQDDGSVFLGFFRNEDKVTLTSQKGQIVVCSKENDKGSCQTFQKNSVVCQKDDSVTVCK